jgi:phosphonate transport system substrate-binding protein
VIGEISDDPDRSITRMQPLADYLAANLSKAGVEAVEIDIPPDLDTMVEKLQNGEIDLTFDSLYPAMIMRNEGGAQPILRRWRDGVGEYHTVFFALAASGIESPDDLKGKMVAFDAPDSTSGYLVPVAFLIEAGLNPVEKSSETAAVAEDEVGYVFSGGDDNTLLWITSGVVAAGVVDNIAFSELPQETLDQVVILAETSPVPRQVVLARGGLDPDLLAAIITVLVGMDETEAGRAALEEYRTSQFDEFPEGLDTALADMEQMYGLVQNR